MPSDACKAPCKACGQGFSAHPWPQYPCPTGGIGEVQPGPVVDEAGFTTTEDYKAPIAPLLTDRNCTMVALTDDSDAAREAENDKLRLQLLRYAGDYIDRTEDQSELPPASDAVMEATAEELHTMVRDMKELRTTVEEIKEASTAPASSGVGFLFYDGYDHNEAFGDSGPDSDSDEIGRN